MMSLMVGLQPAENTQILVMIQIPGSVQWSRDKLPLDQNFKLTVHVVLTSAESKFRFFPQWEKVQKSWGATTATWRSYFSMIQTTIHEVPNWWILWEWKDLLQWKRNPVQQTWRSCMEHWGNSCVAAEHAVESGERSFWIINSNRRNEVEWHSCQ